MVDKPDRSGSRKASSQDVAMPAWQSSLKFWADTLGKLALPVVTAIVALAGTWIASSINRENNVRQTINQREQAESTLRTSMFSQLVAPLIGDPSESGFKKRPEYLTLLTQLLALNFHEHFELGPLMVFVDELPGQTDEDRKRLQSVARRIITRQLALLPQPGQHSTWWNPFNQCDSASAAFDISIISESHSNIETCRVHDGEDPVSVTCRGTGVDEVSPAPISEAEVVPLIEASSPDCQDHLIIDVTEVNWSSGAVNIYVSMDTGTSGNNVDFTLTQFAFPFSDNTLLNSGNRFGIYVRDIETPSQPCERPGCDRRMTLSLVWFPREFIPPRERPTDFEHIRRSLNL